MSKFVIKKNRNSLKNYQNMAIELFLPKNSIQRKIAAKLKNKLSIFTRGYKVNIVNNTAVNYRKHDSTQTAIEADSKYAMSIGFNYLKHIKNYTQHGPEGKRILEIGPGINFGSSFLLKCFGAGEIHLADRFLSSYCNEYHTKIYSNLQAIINKENPDLDITIFKQCIENNEHKANGLFCHYAGLESLSDIPDQHMDIILSNAVFEHLASPPLAFKELARITSFNGIGIHQIDFRDHTNFLKPLEFLLLDDKQREKYLKDCFYESGNCWRPKEYKELFQDCGFKIIDEQIGMTVKKEYLENFIPRLRASNSSYRAWPEEDFYNISSLIIVKRCK